MSFPDPSSRTTSGSGTQPDPDEFEEESLQDGRLLSSREREATELKARGHSNTEIARILGVSESTVRQFFFRARQKPSREATSSPEMWPEDSFVGRLADEDREALLKAGTPLRFEDDAILLVQGDVGDFLYVLVSGLVKVGVAAVSGAQTILAIRSRGDLVGEFALLDNKPRTATARAAGPVTAVKVGGADFLAFTGRSPAVQVAVTKYLLEKMHSQSERRAAERVWDARERLAQVLYDLGEQHAKADADGLIRIPITQSELGELAGVAGSTAERVLKDLRRHGILSTRYREVTIRDMDRLDKIRFPQEKSD